MRSLRNPARKEREAAAEQAAAPDSEAPDFVEQSISPMREIDQARWFGRTSEAMREKGARFFRYSVHLRDKNRRLVEGWKNDPGADQGAPHWPEERI